MGIVRINGVMLYKKELDMRENRVYRDFNLIIEIELNKNI